jgi:hypothetical protein
MKRTGVIIGVDVGASRERFVPIKAELQERYPGVVFTLMNGINGCAVFEFDDGEETP